MFVMVMQYVFCKIDTDCLCIIKYDIVVCYIDTMTVINS
jgi:hypothetical protein